MLTYVAFKCLHFFPGVFPETLLLSCPLQLLSRFILANHKPRSVLREPPPHPFVDQITSHVYFFRNAIGIAFPGHQIEQLFDEAFGLI
jgi:hypothetical protein